MTRCRCWVYWWQPAAVQLYAVKSGFVPELVWHWMHPVGYPPNSVYSCDVPTYPAMRRSPKILGCVKFLVSAHTVGRWQFRQCVGPTCGIF